MVECSVLMGRLMGIVVEHSKVPPKKALKKCFKCTLAKHSVTNSYFYKGNGVNLGGKLLLVTEMPPRTMQFS